MHRQGYDGLFQDLCGVPKEPEIRPVVSDHQSGVYCLRLEESAAKLVREGAIKAHPPAGNKVLRERAAAWDENVSIYKIGASSELNRRLTRYLTYPVQMDVCLVLESTLPFLLEALIHNSIEPYRVEFFTAKKLQSQTPFGRRRFVGQVGDGDRKYSAGREYFYLTVEQLEGIRQDDWNHRLNQLLVSPRESMLLSTYSNFYPRVLTPSCDCEGGFQCFWEDARRAERCDRCMDAIHYNNNVRQALMTIRDSDIQEKRGQLIDFYSAAAREVSKEVLRRFCFLVAHLLPTMNAVEFAKLRHIYTKQFDTQATDQEALDRIKDLYLPKEK